MLINRDHVLVVFSSMRNKWAGCRAALSMASSWSQFHPKSHLNSKLWVHKAVTGLRAKRQPVTHQVICTHNLNFVHITPLLQNVKVRHQISASSTSCDWLWRNVPAWRQHGRESPLRRNHHMDRHEHSTGSFAPMLPSARTEISSSAFKFPPVKLLLEI